MNPLFQPTIAPPAFLQLAGHPLRWRLLAQLARSDRVVHELTALVGEPQNLVSYHLGKLRDGRLVSARRSAADRRDTYYSLDLARIGGQLSATGDALHPGLRLVPPLHDVALMAPVRVLFLCTGNSARSQMAEAMARARSGGAIEAYSAGSHPRPMHPNALRVMREGYGLDLAAQTPKSLDLFAAQPFDWVISLCDRVREVCPEFPGHPEPFTGASPTRRLVNPTRSPIRGSSRPPPSWRPASGSCSPCSPIRPPPPDNKGQTHDRPQ